MERFLSEYDRGLLAEPAVMPSVDPYGLAATGLLFAPGAGVADLTGNAPDPSRPGQMLPSFYENISGGNYLDAGLQALGGAGDAVQMMGGVFPPALAVGAAMKAPRGIRAFHGSPHHFDKFSLDKIGTGEGAQAYGHGLYFAEAEPTAIAYRDELSNKDRMYLNLGGQKIDSVYTQDNIDKFGDFIQKNFDEDEYDDALLILDNLGQGLGSMDGSATLQAADEYADDAFNLRQGSIYERLREFLTEPEPVKGAMYEVNIAADPDMMLDYQMPFSAQSKDVQEKLLKAGYEVDPNTSASGGLILSALMSKIAQKGEHLPGGKITDARRIASERLKDAGIPGIKYLDLGSRTGAKSLKDATSNYVVFDDATIEIMRKYGLLAPLVGAGTVAAVSDMGEENQGIMY